MKIIPSSAVLLVFATVSAAASQHPDSGFIEDSHLDLFLRNAYMGHDFHEGLQDKDGWGQGIIATYQSGFTQGPVGFGVDGIAQYAVRLDGGRGRNGDSGIDFFKPAHNGRSKSQLAKLGATAKLRIANTVLSYGSQRPVLPVVYSDDSRLLYESFTGTMLTSKDITGLEINAGYFTDEQRKSDDRHNSGLKGLAFGGASYQFNDRFSGSLYASNNRSIMQKQYAGLNYTQPLAPEQQLVVDLNGYNSRLDKGYAKKLDTGRNNVIWSLATSYSWRVHTFKLAYQHNSGSTGYHYGDYRDQGGVGDGGNTIWLANSYWSDFNGQDERSWQASYALDFSGLGLPGLSMTTAYVSGNNIKTSQTINGKEREWYNQVEYKVQSGPAKDLALRLRYSRLRLSRSASDYNVGGEEIRAYAEYPLSLF